MLYYNNVGIMIIMIKFILNEILNFQGVFTCNLVQMRKCRAKYDKKTHYFFACKMKNTLIQLNVNFCTLII